MSLIRKMFIKAGMADRRKDGRFEANGLHAWYWTGTKRKRVKIRDLSLTGGYVVTNERWLPGTPVEITLENKSMFASGARSNVRLWASSVRIGEDGVGVNFVPRFLDRKAWAEALTKAAEVPGEPDVISLLRNSLALGFLLRICPVAENEILNLLTRSLSRPKAELVVATVLRAEELLAFRDLTPRDDVSASVLFRILEELSKAEEPLSEQCWAGLLATAASGRSSDEAGLELASLLSHLPASQILILTAACVRAMEHGWGTGSPSSKALSCTAAEIRKITGASRSVPISGDLNHLSLLGLMERSQKPLMGGDIDLANITPTELGMRLFTACCWPAMGSEASGIEDAQEAG
jgi:hypothetical protein